MHACVSVHAMCTNVCPIIESLFSQLFIPCGSQLNVTLTDLNPINVLSVLFNKCVSDENAHTQK